MKPCDISFETVCNFFGRLQTYGKDLAKRHDSIREFYKCVIDRSSGSAFDIMRLVAPEEDETRGNYGLKEKMLGTVIADALGWSRFDKRATGLFNHTNPAVDGAGDLSVIVFMILVNTGSCGIAMDSPPDAKKRLKVGELNDALDKLVKHGGDRRGQCDVMRSLLMRTTARQMKWIVQIILKAPKHGVGVGQLLKHWHPDATDYYNLRGMSLRRVFNDMVDEAGVYVVEGPTPGLCVNPQLAEVAVSPRVVLKHFGDRAFMVETKFDGERMQVHLLEDGTVKYYSRRAINHGERSQYCTLDAAMKSALGPNERPCILDGELVVFDRRTRRMLPFGTLKHTINHAARGSKTIDVSCLGDDETGTGTISLSDAEVMYVVFDVLYCRGRSVIGEPLHRRRALLRELLGDQGVTAQLPGPSCLSVSIRPLLPGVPGCPWECFVADSAPEIEAAMDRVIAGKEEGLVLKLLDAAWMPGLRSVHWLKLKPEYMYRMDIDAVIVGGTWGQGNRAREGGITQYLMALRLSPSMNENRSVQGGQHHRYVTFARVGTGLTREQRAEVNARLKGLLTPCHLPSESSVLACGKEAVDVWVSDPERSVVLELEADVRLMASARCATSFSLRFPRIVRIRHDKAPHQATGEDHVWQQFVDVKEEKALKEEKLVGVGTREVNRKKKEVALVGTIAEKQAVLNAIAPERDVLGGKTFFVLGNDASSWDIKARIKRLGGTPYAIYIPKIQYVIASSPSESTHELRMMNIPETRALVSAWIDECASRGTFVDPDPTRHYLRPPPKHRKRGTALTNPKRKLVTKTEEEPEEDHPPAKKCRRWWKSWVTN